MIKDKIITAGGQVIVNGHSFTEHEKNDILEIIRTYHPSTPEKNSYHFVGLLQSYCGIIAEQKEALPKNIRRENRKLLKGKIKRLIDTFRDVLEDPNKWGFDYKVVDDNSEPGDLFKRLLTTADELNKHDLSVKIDSGEFTNVCDAVHSLHLEVNHTWDHLVRIHEMLKAIDELETLPANKPAADYNNLVYQIARDYSHLIGKPSSYPDGAFVALIREVYKILGWTPKDARVSEPNVKKPVQAALRKLKERP